MSKPSLLLLIIAASAVPSRAYVATHQSACKTHLFQAVEVNAPGCATGYVSMNLCVGACRSVDKYPVGKGESICTCCEPVKFGRREVELLCMDVDGTFKAAMHVIREPTICACKPCRPTRK